MGNLGISSHSFRRKFSTMDEYLEYTSCAMSQKHTHSSPPTIHTHTLTQMREGEFGLLPGKKTFFSQIFLQHLALFSEMFVLFSGTGGSVVEKMGDLGSSFHSREYAIAICYQSTHTHILPPPPPIHTHTLGGIWLASLTGGEKNHFFQPWIIMLYM